MGFLVYDLSFLAIFLIFLTIFLIVKRKNLKREGLLYLYRTKLGIRFIDYIGRKYKRTLNILQYFSITCGYILMAGIFFVFGRIIYTYIRYPEITDVVKAPPVVPIIPYFPKIFGLQSFFPDFSFTYFIIVILVLATVHEFAHGIFARFHKVKVKSTGFGFLGPLLAAFVEPDEKQMKKKSKFAQMSILSAGTFANILTAIFFFVILVLIFVFLFQPAGAIFNMYSFSVLDSNQTIEITDESLSIDGINFTKIIHDDKSYFVNFGGVNLSEENYLIKAYHDLPAINSKIISVNNFGMNEKAITKINNVPVNGFEDTAREINKYSVGDKINIETEERNKIMNYEIVLGESYFEEGKPVIGMGFIKLDEQSFFTKIFILLTYHNYDGTYYKAKSTLIDFIYYLLWWIILINFFAALFNMLPVGIFDGGRFFFLTILAFTKKEKRAVKILKVMAYLIGLIFLLVIVLWFFYTFF